MKILIFGATGTAGGGVLRACLSAANVEEVRALARRPIQLVHPKLRVFLHHDYLNYAGAEQAFTGISACLFCLGISATQVSGEAEYRRITRDFAMAAARTLRAQSPAAAFHFISGKSTSAESSFMWARVKAEAERDLMALANAVCWRPAFIDGELSGSSPRLFRVLQPLFRLLRPFRNSYVHSQDLGRAMLQATTENMRARVIENAEIRDLAHRYHQLQTAPESP